MVGLIVLGVLHAVFLYFGDILTAYGILGLVLLQLRNWSERALLRAALWVWLGGLGLVVLLALGAAAAGDDGGLGRDAEAVRAAYAEGGLWDIVGQRVEDLAFVIPSLVLLQVPTAFAMFALGMVLGRRGVLSRPAEHRDSFRRALRLFLPIGIVGGAAAALLDPLEAGPASALGLVLLFASAPFLTASYVAALALVAERVMRSRALGILRSPGRMSLSVYLLESLAATLVFTGLGLGLFGDVGPAGGLGFAVAIWLGLALLSAAWLAVFDFGPFEWLLRSFGYWRLQPLRSRPPGSSREAGGPAPR